MKIFLTIQFILITIAAALSILITVRNAILNDLVSTEILCLYAALSAILVCLAISALIELLRER